MGGARAPPLPRAGCGSPRCRPTPRLAGRAGPKTAQPHLRDDRVAAQALEVGDEAHLQATRQGGAPMSHGLCQNSARACRRSGRGARRCGARAPAALPAPRPRLQRSHRPASNGSPSLTPQASRSLRIVSRSATMLASGTCISGKPSRAAGSAANAAASKCSSIRAAARGVGALVAPPRCVAVLSARLAALPACEAPRRRAVRRLRAIARRLRPARRPHTQPGGGVHVSTTPRAVRSLSALLSEPIVELTLEALRPPHWRAATPRGAAWAAGREISGCPTGRPPRAAVRVSMLRPIGRIERGRGGGPIWMPGAAYTLRPCRRCVLLRRSR